MAERTEPGLVHVHPLGDLLEHDLTEDCPCGPAPRLATGQGGPDGWLIVHHSLDGRETRET